MFQPSTNRALPTTSLTQTVRILSLSESSYVCRYTATSLLLPCALQHPLGFFCFILLFISLITYVEMLTSTQKDMVNLFQLRKSFQITEKIQHQAQHASNN